MRITRHSSLSRFLFVVPVAAATVVIGSAQAPAQTQPQAQVQAPATAQRPPRQNPRLQVPMDPERARRLYVSKDPKDQSVGTNYQRAVDARVAAEARYPELCKGIIDFKKVS
jgi:hypothetical protein